MRLNRVPTILLAALPLCGPGPAAYAFSAGAFWEKDSYHYNESGVESVAMARPVLADLDGDGDLDLTIGQDEGFLVYYENDGSPSSPRWVEDQGMFGGTEWGISRSSPAFADLDADGDQDLAVGDFRGKVEGYRNEGTPCAPSWEPDTTLFQGIEAQSFVSAPSFCDLDGDDDFDMILGERDEILSYYENTGTPLAPSWTFRPGMFDTLYFGYFTAPTFADIDSDSDFDLLVGHRSGDLKYFYRNIGTSNHAKWRYEVDLFDDIRVEWLSSPALNDLDGDDDRDLVLGDEDGRLHYFVNDGTPYSPRFTAAPSLFAGIDAGSYSASALGDLDGDGDGDLVIGHWGENLLYYTREEFDPPKWSPDSLILAGVTAGGWNVPCLSDTDSDGDLDLLLGDMEGGLRLYENTGDVYLPCWELREDPVLGIDVGIYSAPASGDLDADGDVDLVIGEWDGNINLAMNVGTPYLPRWTVTDTLYHGIVVEAYRSVPFLADFDRDGDPDLVIGKRGGGENDLEAYENIGSPEEALFVPKPHLFSGLTIGLYTTPVLFDSDGDGDLDLSCGEYSGNISFFRNTEFSGIGKPGKGHEPDRDGRSEKEPSRPRMTAVPNPSNAKIMFRVSVEGGGSNTFSLDIYNIKGVRVMTLASGRLEEGDCCWFWNGRGSGGRKLPSGIYMARFSTGRLRTERRVVILD